MSLADTFRKILAAHPAPHVSPPIDNQSETWQGPFGGPGVPIPPLYATSTARRMDYQFGVNVNVVPRSEYQGFIPDFNQLRTFYSLSDPIKVAITFRSQQILANSWNVTTRKGAAATGGGAEKAKKLLQKPDPTMGWNFEAWLGAVLQAMWIHDAVTIVVKRNALRGAVAFQLIDGTTIKPLISYEDGGYPAPPDPAFIQVIKGAPYTAYTSDEMLYKPSRPRDWCIYGESRLERVLEAMTIYQLYESWTGAFFTQGNLPEVAYLTDPASSELASPRKFRKWQKILDIITGTNISRRRAHLIPPFVKTVQELKKYDFSKNLPDWYIRPLCVEFGVPAFMFVSETNRATAKEINEALYEPAIRYDLMSTKRLIDDLYSAAGMPEVEFNWEKTPDYSEQHVKGVVLLCTPFPDGSRIMAVDEGREYLNLKQDTEEGDTDLGGDVDEQASESDQPPPALPAATQASLKALPPATALRALPSARGLGRRFAGPQGVEKRRLAMQFAPIVAKRMRQKQAEIVKQGIELARSRQLKVNGASAP